MFATTFSGKLVNAYEGKAGMVFFAGKTVCPCLSALRLNAKRRYINTLLFRSFFLYIFK